MTERLSKREQARIDRLEAARKASSPEQVAPPAEHTPTQASSPTLLAPGRVYSKVADGRTANAATRLQMEGLRGGLLAEVDQLRAEVTELRPYKEAAQGDADIALYLDPREVAPTRYFNRFEESTSLAEPAFLRLLEDIRGTKGNKVPGGVRPYSGADKAFKYEVIYGSRRLEACKIAVQDDPAVRYRAVLEKIEDEDEAQLLQQVENRLRSDPAVIEQGLSIRSYFLQRYGMTKSGAPLVPDGAAKHVAAKLGLHPKHISRLLLAGSIPEHVLKALPDSRRLSLRVLLEVARACRDEPDAVNKRLKTIPSSASSKSIALHLIGAGAEREQGKNSSRSTVSVTVGEHEQRDAFLKELQSLVDRYGIELTVASGK